MTPNDAKPLRRTRIARSALRAFVAIWIVLFVMGAAVSLPGPWRPSAPSGGAPLSRRGWVLTLHDEFDGARLDRSKWDDRYWSGRTHGNHERQYYASDSVRPNHGSLDLVAERRSVDPAYPYTSGMISSFGHFSQRYGRFEIRARFPRGKGFWPAFWLLPASKQWPPEIDVLEILGHEPARVHFTNHWLDRFGLHLQNGGEYSGPDFSAAYHTFTVDWMPGSIVWYVDGVERFRSTRGVPEEPMYVIANLAVGGDWPGDPDRTTRFPGVMAIDYVRVYRSTSAPGNGPGRPESQPRFRGEKAGPPPSANRSGKRDDGRIESGATAGARPVRKEDA